MKAYAIVIKDHNVSEGGYKILVESSEKVGNEFKIERYDAIVPDQVDQYFEELGIKWTWPDSGRGRNEQLNLNMHAYGGPPKRRHACALSHYFLWSMSINIQEPILVLEHDAIFTQKFDYQYVLDSHYGMIGINDPRNATRLFNKFHDVVQNAEGPLLDCPVIDNMQVPQGIAGNSAYVIKPECAERIIEAVATYGLWPNDAIACQQVIEGLGVTKKYYTTIQGLTSTTFTNV